MTSKTRIIAPFLVFILVVIVVWFKRYDVQYYYSSWKLNHANVTGDDRYKALYFSYLLRLNHTDDIAQEGNIYKNIESISPHIIPLLVDTYNDVNAPVKSRSAAALGMIKADRDLAEATFMPFLESKDDGILWTAIFDLGEAKSFKPYKTIIKHINNPNEKIRFIVVDYLGNFNNPESISQLKQIMNKDQSKEIRDAAAYRLQQLGIMPHQ